MRRINWAGLIIIISLLLKVLTLFLISSQTPQELIKYRDIILNLSILIFLDIIYLLILISLNRRNYE